MIDYDRFSHVFRHPLKHPCAFVNSRTPLRSKRYILLVRSQCQDASEGSFEESYVEAVMVIGMDSGWKQRR